MITSAGSRSSNAGSSGENSLVRQAPEEPGVGIAFSGAGRPEKAAMRQHGSIHVGTSGWHYEHWKGPFFPEDARNDELLALYAERFRTVEINNSFYRLPERTTLIRWRDAVPRRFLFAVKTSRYITHMKKLKGVKTALSNFLNRVDVLGEHLGPLLFQLPPRWHVNAGRLRSFLETLPGRYRYAFEFRDTTWHVEEIYRMLEEFNAAFCIYELAGTLSPRIVTSDMVYVRLHGPGEAYRGRYSDKTLGQWAGAVADWAAAGKTVYCYFDNDEAGYAAQDALRLQGMFGT